MISYDTFTYTPDQIQNIEDLNAIYTWVIQQRSKAGEFPKVVPLIDGFEKWYGSIEERVQAGPLNPIGLGVHRVDQTDVNEAKRRRAAILEATNQAVPDDWPVAHPVPPDKPPEETNAIQTGLYTIGGIVLGGILLKLLWD